MATFNSEKYIMQQLDSIIQQTIKVDELIIVDDYSTDNTIKILNEYIEKCDLYTWKFLKHTVNKGYIESFSEGLRYANGEIIILCDHDDIWLENKVEIILNTFEKNKYVGALATSFSQIDANGESVKRRLRYKHANNNLIRRSMKKGELNELFLEDVLIYNVSPGCTCAIRSDIRDEFLKFTYLKSIPHDWKLMIIAVLKKELFYLDKITTKYRIYEGNTIGLGHVDALEKRIKNVYQNVCEKEETLELIKSYAGIKSNDYKYASKVLEIFKKRYIALKQCSIYENIKILPKGVRFAKLYESICFDLYVILKNKFKDR